MAKYTVKLKAVPKGHVAPPLLADFGKWLVSQPYGSVGWFELVASPVPGSWSDADWKKLQKDAWCFMSLPEGSLLALLDTEKPAPVVLLDSESDKIKLVAPSVEAFLHLLASRKTRLHDLDDSEGEGHAALAAWLKSKKVRPVTTTNFDLAAYVKAAKSVAVESSDLKKQPPAVRQLVGLLGRSTTDDALAADLKKLGLGRLGGTKALRNAKKGITVKFTRNGKDVTVSEVHLGAAYDGPLPFNLHKGGSNDFSVKKILGPPSKKQKAKDNGPVWEKVLDRERGVVYQRSRGHFDWFAEHRFFVQR